MSLLLSKKWIFRGLVLVFLASSFGVAISEIVSRQNDFQWDLRVYYKSPITWAEGKDPYKENDFVYAPLFLPVFKIFSTLFSQKVFYFIYLLARVLSFFLLLFIWKKYYLEKIPIEVFSAFVWVAFNCTFLLDFYAGNISVFETTLLFSAFTLFLVGNLPAFVGLVVLASLFKLAPIFFLGLLLLSRFKDKWKYFCIGVSAFVLFFVLNFLYFPALTREFFSEALGRTGEVGHINPSTLAFISELFSQYLSNLHIVASPAIGKVAFCGIAAVILFASYKSVQKFSRVQLKDSEFHRYLVLFVVLVFAAIAPRMKDYFYMITIPSVLFVVVEFRKRIPYWFIVLPLLMTPPERTWPNLMRDAFKLAWEYSPLLIVYFTLYVFSTALRDPEFALAHGEMPFPTGGGPNLFTERSEKTLLHTVLAGFILATGFFVTYSFIHKEAPTSISLQNWTLMQSQSVMIGDHRLVLQSDGNLVLYLQQQSVWDTGSWKSGCGPNQCHAAFGGDGNFVIYKGDEIVWESNTSGHPNAKLIFSNFNPYAKIVDEDGKVLW